MRAWKTIAAITILCTVTQPAHAIDFEPFSLHAMGRALGVGCGDGYHARPSRPIQSMYYNQITACAQPFGQSDCSLESYDHTHPNNFWRFPVQQQTSCGCSSCVGGMTSNPTTGEFYSPSQDQPNLGEPNGAKRDTRGKNSDLKSEELNSKARRRELERKLNELQKSMNRDAAPSTNNPLAPPTRGVKAFESFGGKDLEFLPPKTRPEYGNPSKKDSALQLSKRAIHRQATWQQPVSRPADQPVWVRNLPPSTSAQQTKPDRISANRPSARRTAPITFAAPRFRAPTSMPTSMPMSMPMQNASPIPHREPKRAYATRPNRRPVEAQTPFPTNHPTLTQRPAQNRRQALKSNTPNGGPSPFWF